MRRVLLFVFAVSALAACRPAPPPAETPLPWFEDEAAARGLDVVHDSGHRPGQRWFPEIACGGVALLDVEDDGDLDVYVVQAGPVTDPAARPPNALFLNAGDGTFAAAAPDCGAGDRGYGMGAATGDYDGDGRVDLYVTNLGANVLLRNRGDGTFEDVTAVAGVGDPGWGSSASFFDFDRDGDLDLYVANYVHWSPEVERACFAANGEPDYCAPSTYAAPQPDVLYRNEGDGTFTDVSVSTGIADAVGTGLGVVVADVDDDGRPDVFVANDGMPNHLWLNRDGVRFVESANPWGVAVDADGLTKAGMGVAVDDIDGDRDVDLLVVNMGGERDSFYRNEGGWFADATGAVGLGVVPRSFTRFGVGWRDFDHDGALDLYEANGRVRRATEAATLDPFAEVNVLMQGMPGGRFREYTPRGGTAAPLVATSRACAFGDIDGDGDVDVVVLNRDGPLHLLINRIGNRTNDHAVRLDVRDGGYAALGARVEVHAGGATIIRTVRTDGSYCAASDPIVHIGLGRTPEIESVRVTWADGDSTLFGPLTANERHRLDRPVDVAR